MLLGHIRGPLPPPLEIEQEVPVDPFTGCHLLKLNGVEEYAGGAAAAKVPKIANLLEVPEKATSAGE